MTHSPVVKKVEILHFLQDKFPRRINSDIKSVGLSEDELGFYVYVQYHKNGEQNYKRYLTPVSELLNQGIYHIIFSPKNDFEYKVDKFINLDPLILKDFIFYLFKQQ